MEDKFQQAVEFYKQGNKDESYAILLGLTRETPEDYRVWYLLALIEQNKEMKHRFLTKSVQINPKFEKAKLLLDELNRELVESPKNFTDRNTSSTQVLTNTGNAAKTKNFTYLFIGVVFCALLIFIISYTDYVKKEKEIGGSMYEDTEEEAESYFYGYALKEMAAGHIADYWCYLDSDPNKSIYSFYKIRTIRKSYYYEITAATKAVNRYCMYDVSYMTGGIFYNRTTKNWQLVDEIYFSNKCVKNNVNDGGCISSQYHGGVWQPDMNWTKEKGD